MAEEKKRLPYRMLAGVVVLVTIAAVLGFIGTVRWRGTLAGRYQHIKKGMSRDEAHRILGPPDFSFPMREKDPVHEEWNEGRVAVYLTFQANRVSDMYIGNTPQEVREHVWWADLYRSAEEKWRAIRRPRR
jgi:hypothetical protein